MRSTSIPQGFDFCHPPHRPEYLIWSELPAISLTGKEKNHFSFRNFLMNFTQHFSLQKGGFSSDNTNSTVTPIAIKIFKIENYSTFLWGWSLHIYWYYVIVKDTSHLSIINTLEAPASISWYILKYFIHSHTICFANTNICDCFHADI